MRNTILWAVCACLALPWTSLRADDVQPPVTQRFQSSDVDETPHFQKHVVPLFGRLGCNGRACHGSFQGRGGFRLSLFGYDFKADHEALFDKESPRVVAGKPDESLIVAKPSSDLEHEGGQRYELGSWEHHVIRNWIAAGAEYNGDEVKLTELQVEPREIVFEKKDESVQLRVVAVWQDGTKEDVTSLCRFSSNDDMIAKIDEDGHVVSGQGGDSHVVVYYDKAVVPIPVMQPVTDLIGDKYPKVVASTPIDEHVITKLRKLGVTPSDKCDDETFLRRVTLDLTGTLPTASDVKQFLSDKSSDKRAKKIDALLQTKAYAAWWTTKLCDFTGNNDQQLVNLTPERNQATQQWYDWIYERIEQNVSYDKLVEGIVLGRSRQPGQSYREYCEEMCELYRNEERDFADLQTMPHYWARREFRNPPERAISFAYSFLGIRIQCAQCHKHPFDQWSKQDFEDFTGFFAYARASNNGATPEDRKEYNAILKELKLGDRRINQIRREFPKMIKEGKTVPFPEVYVNQPRKLNERQREQLRRRKNNSNNQPATARLLGGDELELSDYEDVREPLMNWLRSSENQLFAKAFVNRVWASYFNRGIVEPADDLSLANPPCNEELLDYLADGFVKSGFNMHWIHREILNSDTYQRDFRPNETNRKDTRNFSHAIPRQLPAEVAYDAMQVATAADRVAEQACSILDDRAIAIPGASARNNNNRGPGYALQVFGRSTRESSCDCDRSMDATLLQTVYRRNDQDMLSMIDRRNTGWIDQIARELKGNQGSGANPNGKRLEALQKQITQIKRRRDKLVKGGNKQQVESLDRRMEQLRPQVAQLRKRIAEADEARKASQTAEPKDVKALVQDAYLRTLSRHPSEQEMDRSLAYVNEAEDTVSGLRGLLWALLNTKEFIVNH